MACIDFSFDSRIRKKYVPLINQQRFIRHLKRIAARNLSIPASLLRNVLNDYRQNGNELNVDSNDPEPEEEAILYANLNLVFYFTIHYPLIIDCDACSKSENRIKACCCGKLLYQSEFAMNTNPSWKSFEGSALCSPSISHFIIRIYFLRLDSNKKKNSTFDCEEKGILFLEWSVNLTGLLYIGEELPKDRRFTKNSIIFGLAEGFYTSVCSVASETLLTHSKPPTESLQIPISSSIRNSYCQNTLIRIQMIQCIIRTTSIQNQLERDSLEQDLHRTKIKRKILYKIEQKKRSIELLRKALDHRKKLLRTCQAKIVENDEKLFEYNTDMSSKMQILKRELVLLHDLRSFKLIELNLKLQNFLQSLALRRRLLARKIIEEIYPIVPCAEGPGYSITNAFLPKANHYDFPQNKIISIGLGYCAHLIYILSIIFDIFLFYQIIPFGSRSFIRNVPNKLLKLCNGNFPLYAKSKSSLNTGLFRRGWYFLNQIIVFLRHSMNLRTMDPNKTLYNINSLYLERFFGNDSHIDDDLTLNRFKMSSLRPKENEISLQNNLKILSDIDKIKIENTMIDYLWREVEQMTLQSNRNENTVTEIKEIISKYRHRNRLHNSDRLNELAKRSIDKNSSTSEINSQSPIIVMSSTSSPQSIISNHHRRLSQIQFSLISENRELQSKSLSSNHHCNTFTQINSFRRMRSSSNHTQMPRSFPLAEKSNQSQDSYTPYNQSLSMSLDDGLNFVNFHIDTNEEKQEIYSSVDNLLGSYYSEHSTLLSKSDDRIEKNSILEGENETMVDDPFTKISDDNDHDGVSIKAMNTINQTNILKSLANDTNLLLADSKER
ncbi:phosphatase 1L protein [Sarcoptes scabiei]|nr:phosphatase 1L protein [Sarcoptes scabiei]